MHIWMDENVTILRKEVFEYTDPVTGEFVTNQGIQILTDNGVRVFCRLSGTGTVGATVRFYVERFESDKTKFDVPVTEYLQDVFQFVDEVFEFSKNFGDIRPSAIN